MTSRDIMDAVRCEERRLSSRREDVVDVAAEWLSHYDDAALCSADTLTPEQASALNALLDASGRPDWQAVMRVAYSRCVQ